MRRGGGKGGGWEGSWTKGEGGGEEKIRKGKGEGDEGWRRVKGREVRWGYEVPSIRVGRVLASWMTTRALGFKRYIPGAPLNTRKKKKAQGERGVSSGSFYGGGGNSKLSRKTSHHRPHRVVREEKRELGKAPVTRDYPQNEQ